MTEAHGPSAGELTFIGTATVLLRIGGFTVLTDPNFLHRGDHAKLGYGLRSKRLTEPTTTIDQLPPLDFVVLSHHHGDHFDEVAARDLDRDVPIVTTPHAARKLGRQGFRNPVALDTWETHEVVRGDSLVRVTAMPGRHAPQPLEALLPPVMGSMLDFGPAGAAGGSGPGATPAPAFRLYITGDTLVHDALEEIPRRYPGIDLALVHLGGTRVLGVLVTMDAAQGVQVLRIVQPRAAVPIHYGDYTVFRDPIENFRRAVAEADLPTDVRFVARGEPYRFDVPSTAGGAAPEWRSAGG